MTTRSAADREMLQALPTVKQTEMEHVGRQVFWEGRVVQEHVGSWTVFIVHGAIGATVR